MRCFRDRKSTTTSDPASSLSYTLTQSWQSVAQKTQMTTLIVLLGLGGGFYLATEVITPQIAQANTARANLSVQSQQNETYEALLSRAEAVAKAAAGAKFDGDHRVTDVSITVLAQNHGAIAPILTLEVSRSQWLSRPNVQRWSTYFTTARALLGFEDLATSKPEPLDTATPASAAEDTPTAETEPSSNSTPNAESNNPSTTPTQVPAPGDNSSSQSPGFSAPVDPSGNYQNPTSLPNSVNPVPSTSTPISPPNLPSTVPSTRGSTINNNLIPTSVPESSGVIPNTNPNTPITPNSTIPGIIQPTTPGNLNNAIPNTTPNQNSTPETEQ